MSYNYNTCGSAKEFQVVEARYGDAAAPGLNGMLQIPISLVNINHHVPTYPACSTNVQNVRMGGHQVEWMKIS
jgi:hypothetical protein